MDEQWRSSIARDLSTCTECDPGYPSLTGTSCQCKSFITVKIYRIWWCLQQRVCHILKLHSLFREINRYVASFPYFTLIFYRSTNRVKIQTSCRHDEQQHMRHLASVTPDNKRLRTKCS